MAPDFTRLYDRWKTGTLRKEDMNRFWQNGTFKGALSKETETIFSEIYEFVGYAQLLPSDIIEYEGGKGDAKVILDDKETKEVEVTLEELRETLKLYEEELKSLKECLKRIPHKQQGDKSIKEIVDRINKLEDKIAKLEEIIGDCKKHGKDGYIFRVELLGYYIRRDNPEIHLMMGSIGADHELAAIVLVHEMMHAYFDNQRPYVKHPHCSVLEEPLAEYGMLCFIEMFERFYPKYYGILDKAKNHVISKSHHLGVCHYGFGYYLFEDKSYFCVDWVTLYHQVCTRIDCNCEDVMAYKSQISPVKYPRNQHACEEALFRVLRPKRFYFETVCSWTTRNRFYFQANHLRNNMEIHLKYPDSTRISLKIESADGTNMYGGASIYTGDSCIFLKGKLKTDFELKYSRPNCYRFAFYEEIPATKSSLAVWVAKELQPL